MNPPPEFSLTIQSHDESWVALQVEPFDDAQLPWLSGVWKRLAAVYRRDNRYPGTNAPWTSQRPKTDLPGNHRRRWA